MNFNIAVLNEKNWDVYSQRFTPQAIMSKFDSVFVKGGDFDPKYIGPFDKLRIEGYKL